MNLFGVAICERPDVCAVVKRRGICVALLL